MQEVIVTATKTPQEPESVPAEVITPKTLRRAYNLEVEWIGDNGRRFIYPRLDKLPV